MQGGEVAGSPESPLASALVQYADLSADDRSKHRIGSDGMLKKKTWLTRLIGVLRPEAQARKRSELYAQAMTLVVPQSSLQSDSGTIAKKIDPAKLDKLSRGIAAVFAREVRGAPDREAACKMLVNAAVLGKLSEAVKVYNDGVSEGGEKVSFPQQFYASDSGYLYLCGELGTVSVTPAQGGILLVKMSIESSGELSLKVHPDNLEVDLKSLMEVLQNQLAAKSTELKDNERKARELESNVTSFCAGFGGRVIRKIEGFALEIGSKQYRVAITDDFNTVKKRILFDLCDRLGGANLNQSQKNEFLALACESGNFPAVEKWLNAGADVCAEDGNGRTPLQIAQEAGTVQVVRRVIGALGQKDEIASLDGKIRGWAKDFGLAPAAIFQMKWSAIERYENEKAVASDSQNVVFKQIYDRKVQKYNRAKALWEAPYPRSKPYPKPPVDPFRLYQSVGTWFRVMEANPGTLIRFTNRTENMDQGKSHLVGYMNSREIGLYRWERKASPNEGDQEFIAAGTYNTVQALTTFWATQPSPMVLRAERSEALEGQLSETEMTKEMLDYVNAEGGHEGVEGPMHAVTCVTRRLIDASGQEVVGSLHRKCDGDLRGLQADQLTKEEGLEIARQLFSGLDYLHNDRGILHSDIKPPNILFRRGLGEDGKSKIEVFISDLGGARRNDRVKDTPIFSPLYNPAKLFDPNRSATVAAHRQCDVYAVAISLVEVLGGGVTGGNVFNTPPRPPPYYGKFDCGPHNGLSPQGARALGNIKAKYGEEFHDLLLGMMLWAAEEGKQGPAVGECLRRLNTIIQPKDVS